MKQVGETPAVKLQARTNMSKQFEHGYAVIIGADMVASSARLALVSGKLTELLDSDSSVQKGE